MKSFKDKLKKTIKIFTIVFVSIMVVGIISFSTVYAIAKNSAIDKNTAINTAYSAAGVEEKDIDAIKTKFKFDDGMFVYEVEFHAHGMEYEYKIHSKNGSVLEFDAPPLKPLPKDLISIDKAKELVLTHAGFDTKDVTFTKLKTDKENGRHIYEIEFYINNVKYEYEISSIDGKIKRFELKSEESDDSAPTPEDLIFIEQAKEIALNQANVTKENAHFTKAKLEKNNGEYIFEIEFIADGTKYEFEINAETGKIIEIESDETPNVSELINIENAKNIALSFFSLSPKDTKFTEASLEKENSLWVYEIEFVFTDKLYECVVNAKDGSIIKAKEEPKKQDSPPPQPRPNEQTERNKVDNLQNNLN